MAKDKGTRKSRGWQAGIAGAVALCLACFGTLTRQFKNPVLRSIFWGNYVRHRDYDTSEEINKFLKQCGKEFYVKTPGKLFFMEVMKNQ